jgi:hypothetical protein
MSKSTTKKAAATRKAAAPKRTPQETERARQADLEAKAQEAYQARVEEATEDLANLERSVTQREWLLIRQRLNASREEIAKEGGLRLLALAWIREKREHGGASWDRLLEMTDEDLVRLHGFPVGEDDVPPDGSEDADQDADQDAPDGSS